jgi:tetratricopeptide (TPR) repeat protein
MSALSVLRQTARQHLALGEWSMASHLAQRALRHDPDDGAAHEVEGIASYELEQFGSALHHLEAATTLTPLGVEAQLILADLYIRCAQTAAACCILDYLAEGERCSTPLLPTLAKALGRAGRPHTALGVCQRLTDQRPGFHPAWFGLAYYRTELGYEPTSLELPLRMAFELAPQSLMYRVCLAALLTDLQQLEEAYLLIHDVPVEAVRCLCQCKRLASVCHQLNDQDRAVAFLQRGAELVAGRPVDEPFE